MTSLILPSTRSSFALASHAGILSRLISGYLPVPVRGWMDQTTSDRAVVDQVDSSNTILPIPLSQPITATLTDILIGWGILLAVPKSKVSHSRKGMRSANKGLKNKTNISLCPACSSPKLAHHVCPRCYSQISRRWKEEASEIARGGGADFERGSVV